MTDKLMGALSLCKKAGALEVGFDNVCKRARAGEIGLLLFASDLSPATRKRVLSCAGACPARDLQYTQGELATITRKPAGVLAVTNLDLAALCLAKMPVGEVPV